jgi:hypothetical protein
LLLILTCKHVVELLTSIELYVSRFIWT